MNPLAEFRALNDKIEELEKSYAELIAVSMEQEEREKKLKKENEILTGCVEFYADIDSWNHLTTESIKYHKICISDIGEGEFYKCETDDNDVGGKRARQCLAKLGER